jgi:hypothetical protein
MLFLIGEKTMPENIKAEGEVTITKNHVTLTIVGFVSMIIFIVTAVSAGAYKIAEYKSKIEGLEEKVIELKIKQQKIDNLELNATMRSIDRRLGNIETSAFMKMSKTYEGWVKPAAPK